MATTIQVSEGTKQLLEVLKKRERARTYDQIIKTLAKKQTGVKVSMFNTIKGFSWKKESDRVQFDR